MRSKIKSFTLSELLVVMIITAIVVGIAFSVLRLVQKQIFTIQNNLEKKSNLSLFEQQICQDFNELHNIRFDASDKKLLLMSEMDTVTYTFEDTFSFRNADTIKLKLNIEKMYFEGKETKQDNVDALLISANAELPDYTIFVSKKNDLTFKMNHDGL